MTRTIGCHAWLRNVNSKIKSEEKILQNATWSILRRSRLHMHVFFQFLVVWHNPKIVLPMQEVCEDRHTS